MLSHRISTKKLIDLHMQLNIIAEKTGVPKEYFYNKYSEKIASKVSGLRKKNINKYIVKDTSHCKKVVNVFEKIFENNLLNPPEFLGLKDIKFHPFVIYKFAEEISSYPKFELIDRKRIRRKKMVKELQILTKIREEYAKGNYMFKEVIALLDEKINHLDIRLKKLDDYFSKLILYPQYDGFHEISMPPSPTRPKDVSRTYFLALLFVIMKRITNIPNMEIYAQLSGMFDHFDFLPEVSEDAIARGLTKSRDGGMVESIKCLIEAREKKNQNAMEEHIPFFFDIDIDVGRKKNSERKKKLYNRLYVRLTSLD